MLSLVRDPSVIFQPTPLRTTDDFYVDPSVVILQVINHAHEHREQIKSMLTALGIEPPEIASWEYGEAVGSLLPPENEQ